MTAALWRAAFVVALIAPVVSAASRQAASGSVPQGPVQLPGVRLWCIDTGGGGPAVVALHAATGSSQVWQHQIPAFTRAGFRFIACDRRGYGRTVVDDGASAAPATAADDLEQLAQALGLSRFHVIGTAAGGIVALDYALSFPSRLRTLVVRQQHRRRAGSGLPRDRPPAPSVAAVRGASARFPRARPLVPR